MVRRKTLQWMGHVLRMDEDRLPRQVVDCSLARSVAEDGRVEQLKCRILQSGGAMRNVAVVAPLFWDFLKLPGYTKLIPWPEIRAAAAERALGRQAWRDAITNLAPLDFKNPNRLDVPHCHACSDVLRRLSKDAFPATATEQPPAELAAHKQYEAGRAAAQCHIVIPDRGRGCGGRGRCAARSHGCGRGHGRERGGGVDESDNESDDEAADESDAEATASEDPGLHVNEAGDAASDAENADDDLPLSTLQSALQGV
eukprot:366516-Chlamydomonas_euryale.AAC.7